jgi:hypothetical protein
MLSKLKMMSLGAQRALEERATGTEAGSQIGLVLFRR